MQYMLDTDTASHFIKQNPKVVEKAKRFLGEWCISSIVYQELMSGLLSFKGTKYEEAFAAFLRVVDVVPFTKTDALVAAELAHSNKAAGHNIGFHDAQIAAHAASANLTLVTNNTKHFAPMLGVHVTNWVS
jgi:tRNA(fMet)-specific endonuclease VapC